MSVQVNIQIKPFFVFTFELFCKFHQVESLRKGIFSRLIECSVEILSEQTGPVVSCNHPVRVQHRHYVEYIPLSQLLTHCIIAAYTAQHPLSHKRSIRLPGMHSARDQYYLFVVLRLVLVSYLQNWNSKSTQSFHSWHLLGVFELGKKSEEAGVGVGYAVGEVDSVLGNCKIIGKRHCKMCV